MEWLVLVTISFLLTGIGSALSRYILREEHVYSYGFLYNILSAAVFVPLLLSEPITLPSEAGGWFLILSAAVLWWTINILGFLGISKTEATLGKPLSGAKVLIVLAVSWLVLGEQLTALKVVGTLLVVAGLLVLTWRKGWLGHLRHKGVQLTLAAAVFYGFVTVLDKYNTSLASANVYGFLMYFIPAIPLGMMSFADIPKLKQTLHNKWRAIILVALCYGGMYYFLLNAYRLAEVSVVYPIVQLGTLVTMALAYFWLGEKAEFKQRVLGALLMIAGAVLVRLGA